MQAHTTRYRGLVKGLNQDYDDPAYVNLEIEDLDWKPPKKKKGAAESMPAPPTYRPSRTHRVPRAFAEQFAIGDRVLCETTVKKVRRARRAGRST